MNEKNPSPALPEHISRTVGREAQKNNILAARIIADIVKTTLGPKGMDKLLVDRAGNTIVTNDGVTILEEMEIDHPAAKMMVDIAKTQENEVGDGTTTVALLAGKLLEHAEKLLDRNIHPTLIVKGYKLATEKSLDILNNLANSVADRKILEQIAATAMTGKGAEGHREKLANLIVDAVDSVAQGKEISLNDIKIQKVKGGGIQDSELIEGITIDKERANIEMPEKIEYAKILIIDFSLEIKNPESEAKISVSSPDQLQSFLAAEESYLRELSERIISSGANVVICQKGIDDVVQYYLAKKGILAFRRVSKSDMEKIARATSGKIISTIQDIYQTHLGKARVVEELKNSEDSITYIRGCENPRAVTLVIHGSTEQGLDEMERAIKDGLGNVIASVKSGKIVAGGGAVEIEVAKQLRSFSKTVGGREQLAIDSFANSLEAIPETLAENAGLDPIEVITELKKQHEAGYKNYGLNLFNNSIEDTLLAGIVEPLKVKTQAIISAAEVATIILRIDDVLMSKDSVQRGGNNSAYKDLD